MSRASRWGLAFAGVVAVASSIGAGELLAGLIPGAPSPVLSIGRRVIEFQPPGAKDFMTSLFGTNDKLVLEIVIVVVALAIGASLGILAERRRDIAASAIAAFAGLGFLASLGDPDSVLALAAGGAAVEAFVGMQMLGWLVGLATAGQAKANAPSGPSPALEPVRSRTDLRRRTGSMPDWTRRNLLIRGGAVAAGSVAAVAFGRVLLEGQRRPVSSVNLPSPGRTASLPTGADLGVSGITPIVVPNDDFYRIDTALIAPNVDALDWKLTVKGMVDREVELTYAELTALPIVEQYVTIACVSNEVGGGLVGNALWRGVPLRTVLDMAGVQAGATQLVGRSVDGFTVGMPTEWVMDTSREPLIAVGMNGEPLPRAHGYPARLIVPGLFGYVSATKWLSEIELTTLEAFDAYWVPLGWAKEAPILTQSRIDVPRPGAALDPGRIPIAGVAWAIDRGISKVEVAIDGVWHEARLSTPISNATWVQWVYDWDATPGTYELEVRATDGTGAVQTADRSAPAPDGARGHHKLKVRVA